MTKFLMHLHLWFPGKIMTKAPAFKLQQYLIFCGISNVQEAFKSICSVKIDDNVCHVVDRSSYLAYTVLLWHGDQAVRFKKSEVSRIT